MSTATLPGASRLTTGALARTAGVSVDTIRFYERKGLLPPAERTSGDHRRYPPEAADRLTFIQVGQRLGLRLEEIKELADACEAVPDCPAEHAAGVLRERIADVERRIAELTELRHRLGRVVERLSSHHLPLDDLLGTPSPAAGTEPA